MPVVLPIACWITVPLVFVRKGFPWRIAFLSASIVWGVLLTFLTEGFSLFHALAREYLALAWAGAALIAVVCLFVVEAKERLTSWVPFSRSEKALIC